MTDFLTTPLLLKLVVLRWHAPRFLGYVPTCFLSLWLWHRGTIGLIVGRTCHSWWSRTIYHLRLSYDVFLTRFSLLTVLKNQFRDATLRQTLQVAVSSDKIRIVLSNTFGGVPLPITSATVAFPVNGKAGVSGIQANTLVPLTFNGGSRSVTVPTGQTFTSDELNFPVKGQQVITVSLYLQQGQQTSNIDGHPGSRTTSWLVAGNKVDAADFSGTSTVHWCAILVIWFVFC